MKVKNQIFKKIKNTGKWYVLSEKWRPIEAKKIDNNFRRRKIEIGIKL